MTELGAAYLMKAMELIQRAEIDFSGHPAPRDLSLYIKLADEIESNCTAIGLGVSADQAVRIRRRLSGEDADSTYPIQQDFAELKKRMMDELKKLRLFYITKEEEKLYKKDLPFSPSGQLAAAADDVVEAGKCLALGRFTASVLHLMRAMEIGVLKFGVATAAFPSLPDKEWGKVTRAIHMMMFPNPPAGATPNQQALQKKYAPTLMALDAVRVACRNPTMHAKASYGEEDARQIYDATRAFLAELETVL